MPGPVLSTWDKARSLVPRLWPVAAGHKVYLELCRAADLEKHAAADALINANLGMAVLVSSSLGAMFAAGRTLPLADLALFESEVRLRLHVTMVQAILTMRFELGLPSEWVEHLDMGDNRFESFTPEGMAEIESAAHQPAQANDRTRVGPQAGIDGRGCRVGGGPTLPAAAGDWRPKARCAAAAPQ